MTLEQLPDWAERLLADSRAGHLAYLDEHDLPRVLPVTFAVAGSAVWTAIDDKPKRPGEPARVRYLRRRPEAALCVDRYDDDWSRLAWVQLLGRVEVLELGDGGEGLAALTERYAPYRRKSPPGPLLRLEVERALWWSAALDG